MKKKSKKSLYKKLYKECMNLMSEYSRKKNASPSGYVNCITCGALKHWKELHSGHYLHGVLDFDPINRHPQCPQCNTFKHGNLAEYHIYLVKTYGQKAVDDLRSRAMEAKKGKKYTIEELECIKKDLEKKIQNKNGCYEIGL